MNKLVVLAFIFSSALCFGQTTHIGKQANAIHSMVQKLHYRAKPLDDTLSTYVFDAFIEAIDPSGFYFRQSDIDQLEEYRFEIDDQIKASRSEFFDVTTRLYEKRLKTADSLITEVLKSPFDFQVDEHLSYREEDYDPYLLDTKKLQERWRKWLKYSVLEELFEGDYLKDAAQSDIDSILLFKEEAIKAVEEYERFEISSFLTHPAGYRNYMATFYLGVIANYYDPHTNFFSVTDREAFEEDLSGENLAYGFSLKEDGKGRIMIAGLTPGSAAWMSNQLNKDDEILEIQFEKGKNIDVTMLSLNELILIFDNEKSKSLVMKIRKANGTVDEVALTKAEIYVDQDVIKSVILEGDKKVGYITLPDFYTNWNDPSGLGCANDVAKNIVKLKQENIDGLILDLRNNGGGSLKEAIDLAGIFINYGPVTVEADKYGDLKTIKDMNKGAIYTGPLVVLVNGLSASASEIFSAAMQDHNRAIIVGSTTYGKSTGQVIIPLDPGADILTLLGGGGDDSYGNLKITQSKYYRITQKTHQKLGVVPDVQIRDYYELYDYAEAAYPNAIENDEIVKKMYYTPGAEIPTYALQQNSDSRLAKNLYYKKMCAMIDSIQAYDEYYDYVPLNIEAYQKNEQRINAYYDGLFADDSLAINFKAINNKFDAEIMQMNAFRAKLNEKYLEEIENDLYISEAYSIIKDYIQLK